MRTWVIWGGNGHVLKSIVVGCIAVLVSAVAGVTSHQEEISDSKSIVCGLWVEN